MIHVSNLTYIPSTNVLVEGGAVSKGVGHIGHRRNIPVADVAVGGVRGGLIGEPQIDRRREIGVGEGGTTT